MKYKDFLGRRYLIDHLCVIFSYSPPPNTSEELKKARNASYHVIRKVKRQCWQSFLQGKKDNMRVQSADKNRTALAYIKPQQSKTTLALKDPLGNIAISMKDKEAMV